MANYGIIDCGSNTIRLCIFDVKKERQADPKRKREIKVLLNHKVMAGLAAYVEDGIISKRGIKKAIDVINDQLERAAYFKCARLDVFATAVIRNCKNSEQAVEEIQAGIGKDLRLLSGYEEAHLGFVGAQSGEKTPMNGTLMDIGGGSTEITCITQGNDSDNISIPQGSLSSFSAYVQGVVPSDEESANIVTALRERITKTPCIKDYRTDVVYGIGGSVRAIAKVYGELFCEGKKPTTLKPADIDRVIEAYRSNPATFGHTALSATPDRLHTLMPGCLIARELMEEFGAKTLHICKPGLREGYLLECML